MLQSMQAWLPLLHEPVNFSEKVANESYTQKFIAHCVDDTEKKSLFSNNISKSSCIILIGPEGDFTINEIALARDNGFIPVSLGSTRLRTETAGLYAAVVLNK
jgi:16S rRNA (uracil1498-N3)-methyltransferase